MDYCICNAFPFFECCSMFKGVVRLFGSEFSKREPPSRLPGQVAESGVKGPEEVGGETKAGG